MVQFMCDVLNERAGAYRPAPRTFSTRGGRGGARGGYHGGGRQGPSQASYQQEEAALSPETLYREFALSAHEMKILADAVKGLKIRSTHRGAVRVYRVNSLKMIPADELT